MPVEPVVTLIVLAVIANLTVMAIVIVPSMVGRRNPVGVFEVDAADTPERRVAELAAMVGGGTPEASADADVATRSSRSGVAGRAYDRVVRIVSWGFIFATGAIVAVTGHWQDTAPAIYLLLALAGVLVLVLHDLLPEDALGPAKFIVEGSLAITFATLLVVLTGREESPFFFVFPLIVGGAALVVSPRTTLVLTAIASVGYIVAVGVFPAAPPVRIQTVVTVGINLIALILLAYVAVVIAREQRRARDAAIRLSTVDSLTGLFNRAFFFAALEREIARSARSGRGFCLLMMDLDELKDINDRHGHFVGDRVLRGVGEVIRHGVRRIDLAARYAGDEFVVLLPETDPTGAYVLAEKIRFGVNALDENGTALKPSVSIGVVSYPGDGETADELMITADQAMYASKRAGKNRVMGAPADMAPRTEERPAAARAGRGGRERRGAETGGGDRGSSARGDAERV